jgi:FixJ family two-component response regulator
MTTGDFIVSLVDDDRGVVKALTRLLEAKHYEVRGFRSAEEFLAAHDPTVPGCVILDFNLPDLDGIEVQARLASKEVNQPIIFVSGSAEVPVSVRAMKAGAVDFLTKPVRSAQLIAAIMAAYAKDTNSREHREQLRNLNSRIAKLTPRERQVMHGVIKGRMNKQIAADLGIAEKTVKLHRGRMMRKLAVRSVAELVHLTDRTGMEAAREPVSRPTLHYEARNAAN